MKKQLAHEIAKGDVHIVEKNEHHAMRRKGGQRKKGMNRTMDHAAPAKTIGWLKHQCAKRGKTFVEVQPHSNTRQCVHCNKPQHEGHTNQNPLQGLRGGHAPRHQRGRQRHPQSDGKQQGRGVPAGPQPGGDSARTLRARTVPGVPRKPWAGSTSPCELGAKQAPKSNRSSGNARSAKYVNKRCQATGKLTSTATQ